MRVIVVKQYKQYVQGTELDISEKLFEDNKKHFKAINKIQANSAPAPAGKYIETEEE